MADPPTYVMANSRPERKNLTRTRWGIVLIVMLMTDYFLYQTFSPSLPRESF